MTHPLLLEINTRGWLRSLSELAGRPISLANVPDAEFQYWRRLGLTHLWLMGVWPTGPRSRAFCQTEPNLRARFRELLPESDAEDLSGSPYAIAEYSVCATLGGEAGLKTFRKQLNAHGIKLLLDFIPNHVGLDHAWISERPEVFVQSATETPHTISLPNTGTPRWFAHGRDPYFPPWSDTVQLDYRRAETRAAMLEELRSLAQRCDGVRCDMAMLSLNDVFDKTWAGFPGADTPQSEFWGEAIAAIKAGHANFLFLAEAYWGLEAKLQSLGFDYTYDKRVYDFLVERRGAELQKYLLEAPSGFLSASTHFLENHDEPRIATMLSPVEHRAAALLMLGLPGMRMLYEGQLAGRRLRVPVQFSRWPDEPVDVEIQSMYEQMFAALEDTAVGRGNWKLLPPLNEPETSGSEEVIVVQWQHSNERFDLVVVNLAPRPARCTVQPDLPESVARGWQFWDALGGKFVPESARELQGRNLALDLPAHAAQLLRFYLKG